MSYLAHIAARALGLPETFTSPMMPKGRGVAALRAAAPEDEAPEAADVPADGPVARAPLLRATSDDQPAPKDEDQPGADDDPPAPAGEASREAAPEDGRADEPAADEPVNRAMWREVEAPAEGDDDEPVSRATPPAAEDQPTDDQEYPEETRNETVPGRVLAARRAPLAPTDRGRSPAYSAPMPVLGTEPSANGMPPDPFWSNEAWRPAPEDDGGDGQAYLEFPSAGESGGDEAGVPPPTAFAPPAPSGSEIVIEQIDVFVQEPAPREASRPRLSDPSLRAVARYLWGL